MSTLAVTGAGNAHYIAHLQREFIGESSWTHGRLKAEAEQRIKAFHNDHVIPFASYGQDRPEVWMLLAAQESNGARTLLTSEGSVVNEQFGCAAVGVGATYANLLLNRLMSMVDLWGAAFLAIYVAFCVKEFIDGCGKDTDVACFWKGGAGFIRWEAIRAIEDLLGRYSCIENRMLYHLFTGRLDSTADSWRSVARDVREIRKKCEKLLQPSSAIISLTSHA
jgi:hypothetical protein